MRALILGFLLLPAAAAAQPGAAPPGIVPLPADAKPVGAFLTAPSLTLSNDLLTAKIYLPDRPDSFYRSTRFDQFGTIGSLTYRGQDFYGPWFEAIAEVRDYVMAPSGVVAGVQSADSGPVEEFNTEGKALGYDAAPVGGTFIKIGVGVLRKPDDKPYDRYRAYDIVSRGKVATKATKNAVTFTQDLSDAESGFSYHYEKTLSLVPGKPQLVIGHVLRNTGQKAFTTQVYDHNFLTLSPGNEGVTVTVPYTLKPPATPPAAGRGPAPDLLAIDDHRISFRRPLAPTERGNVQAMPGFGAGVEDYDFRIGTTRNGAGVMVKGDHPLANMAMFSTWRIVAVEPTINLDLPVGGEQRWTYTYSYSGPTP